MTAIVHIKGPSGAGPGERQLMMDRATGYLADVAPTIRIDVPQRGSESDGEGVLRTELEVLVPALQSGSLFGDRQGVEIVDGQWIQKAEADILAELLRAADPAAVLVVFITAGALPTAIARVVKDLGETVTIKRFNQRSARDWLAQETRARRLSLPSDAADALLQRFGTDVASMGQALDQLELSVEPITRQTILDRFKNRPDEGMWHYVDELDAGNTAGALRRLEDFLTHGHPLQLIGYLEGDLKRRSLVASAPDVATYATWSGQKADDWRVEKAWRNRKKTSTDQLRQAVTALAKADRLLKSAPEETHRLTMERLTIALSRWYGR